MSKPSQNRYAGLHWNGKTKQGVPKWRGSVRALPAWLSNIFKVGGSGFVIGGATSLFLNASDTAGWMFIGMGCIYLGTGWWMQRLRNTFVTLMSAEELATAKGVSKEDFLKDLFESNVRPKINLNDEDMYDPRDISAGAILLRPAAQELETVNLLRPAGSGVLSESEATLLRPTMNNVSLPNENMQNADKVDVSVENSIGQR